MTAETNIPAIVPEGVLVGVAVALLFPQYPTIL